MTTAFHFNCVKLSADNDDDVVDVDVVDVDVVVQFGSVLDDTRTATTVLDGSSCDIDGGRLSDRDIDKISADGGDDADDGGRQ